MPIFKQYSLTPVLLFAFLIAGAQKNKNLQGYIILSGNDTLACQFNSFNSKKHPASINVNLNGRDTILQPHQILEFNSPSGEKFVTRKIHLYKYNLSVQNAMSGETPEIDTIPAAFLNVLYRGKITLYLFRDALRNDHFFIEKNNDLQEIYTHVYITTIGQTPTTLAPYLREQSITNNFQFLFQLKKMMQDCNKMFETIDQTELKERSLITLLKKYESCGSN